MCVIIIQCRHNNIIIVPMQRAAAESYNNYNIIIVPMQRAAAESYNNYYHTRDCREYRHNIVGI